MSVAIIKCEFIAHLDGVNMFITNIAEGLRALGPNVVIASWSYRDLEPESPLTGLRTNETWLRSAFLRTSNTLKRIVEKS